MDELDEAARWPLGRCVRCRRLFGKSADYMEICTVCYKMEHNFRLSASDLQLYRLQRYVAYVERIQRELGDSRKDTMRIDDARLSELITLCHPDRHKNSERANKVTAWLLSLRQRS